MKYIFRIFSFLFLCSCVLLNIQAQEAESTFIVGQTECLFSEDASGDGWSYDADSLTFTLDGLDLAASENYWEEKFDFFYAPEQFQIILKSGSYNRVPTLSFPEKYSLSINGGGTLTVLHEAYGNLILNGGNLRGDCLYGGTITLNSGSIELERTKAASSITVNGGILSVSELDTYALELHGGTITANYMSNCNGTEVSRMKYALTGGKLVLDNPDSNRLNGVFNCVTYFASLPLLKQELAAFEHRLVGKDGKPLTLKYLGYSDDDTFENPPDTHFGIISASLCNSDGTPALYAEFSPAASCLHTNTNFDYNEGTHWNVCSTCGEVIADTTKTHNFVSFGETEHCVCGFSRSAEKIEPISAEAPAFALEFYLGLKPMSFALFETLDRNQDFSVSLQEVAALNLICQQLPVPESFTAIGMTFQESGKARNSFDEQISLDNGWSRTTVYVVDPITFAPLCRPFGIDR